MQEEKDDFGVVYDSVLRFIRVLVYGTIGALIVGAAFFWFSYEVEGKPLSAYTSEVGAKLAKQLVEDGYFAGAKVLFTEKEYCISPDSGAHKEGVNCITKKDQKKLDILIDRALFNGGANGQSDKK
tara:strand:- start:61 stop:438 length:378 start_codon:yes stop_codon:yes gene_type:complete